jgi:anti-anti-sigma factor
MAESVYRHMSSQRHEAALVATIQEKMLRDAAICYALRDELALAIDATGAENVVLDLSHVQFIGSVGFLAFLGVRRRLDRGRVVLCGMSDNIREMFRLCGLIAQGPGKQAPLEEADTVDTALQQCSKPSTDIL